jgi:hypothetical protein
LGAQFGDCPKVDMHPGMALVKALNFSFSAGLS